MSSPPCVAAVADGRLRYYEDAPTPDAPSRTLIEFAMRYRELHGVISLPPVHRAGPRAGCLLFGTTLKPTLFRGGIRPLEFRGDPGACPPCSSTPAGPRRQAIRRRGTVPAGGNCEDSRNNQGFRSSVAGLDTLAVYASQPPSPTTTQDSLPAVGQTLPGGTGYPPGPTERFLQRFLHCGPPFLS